MENINKIPSKIIEIEISIKLLEYLKKINTIDDEMYNFCINKLLKKQEFVFMPEYQLIKMNNYIP